jgi:hypothetical protein
MSFMLKIRWDISEGQEANFKTNQVTLCDVMLEHPGVICYHADYPSANVSEWVEIYATDEAFAAHLENEKGKEPLGALIGACDNITCQCWGDPSDDSKKILEAFSASYQEYADNAFVLNPGADKDSLV